MRLIQQYSDGEEEEAHKFIQTWHEMKSRPEEYSPIQLRKAACDAKDPYICPATALSHSLFLSFSGKRHFLRLIFTNYHAKKEEREKSRDKRYCSLRYTYALTMRTYAQVMYD